MYLVVCIFLGACAVSVNIACLKPAQAPKKTRKTHDILRALRQPKNDKSKNLGPIVSDIFVFVHVLCISYFLFGRLLRFWEHLMLTT